MTIASERGRCTECGAICGRLQGRFVCVDCRNKRKERRIAEGHDPRAALEAIRKHIEISVPTGYKLSTVWQIANRALGDA